MENLNPYWNIITIVIAVIGVLVSWRQNKSKKLLYETTLYPLFEINDSLKDDLEIKYKNEIVTQIYTCIITIKNYGTSSIKKEDFDEPINFTFKNCKNVFSIEHLKASPENLSLNIEAEKEKNIFKIHPLLLNATDYFTVKLILEGENINVDVNSRILGVKQIINKKDIQKKTDKITNFFMLIFGLLIMSFTNNLGIKSDDFRALILIIGMFCVGYGTTSTISTIISYIKESRKDSPNL